MESYTINDVAMMTGLTTRTLRGYLKLGLLNGVKENGVWKFTEEDLSDFIAQPFVKSAIQAKNKAVIFDFLTDESKKENGLCVVLDLYIGDEESKNVSEFFCDEINKLAGGNVRFNYERSGKNTRIILSGSEDAVAGLMAGYYSHQD